MTETLRDLARKHAEHTRDRVAEEANEYDEQGVVPLPGYAGSLTAFALTVASVAVAGRATGRGLPERYDLADIALGALATHKFTRLISKGSVTSPIRAPFTEFEAAAGSAELNEQARGGGVRHTIGELLTCPFCLGQWVGTGYVAGLGLAPRPTRAWAAVFAVTGVSDILQQVYARLRTS
ncbi:MAG TPA: DUF1360 domain-containing protein [Nocardioidaceae bacterium]|jgi:hypothetical protein|nr:DUF1360 domain-containing protein [Nocardioidaceae bacterium]